jgi:hypothetical protein
MREGVIPHFVAIVSDSSEEFALLILSARCLLIAPDYKERGLYTEASESIEYVLRGGLRPRSLGLRSNPRLFHPQPIFSR